LGDFLAASSGRRETDPFFEKTGQLGMFFYGRKQQIRFLLFV
jgi:hypothetical protein